MISRRIKHLLRKARDRSHVLVGLAIAVANIDEIIALIRAAPDPQTAREQLMVKDWPAKDIGPMIELIDDPRHQIKSDGTIKLSEEQARAILELRLQRLTALGREEIAEEMEKLAVEIRDYLDILGSRERIVGIIKSELTEAREAFATPRRTEITEGGAELEDEDLIQREDMVVTFSHEGYVKRVPLATYRAQRRGGKGRSGMSTKDEDFVTRIFVVNTHTPVLFFSSRGIVYRLKVWRLPLAQPQSRGRPLINLLPLQAGERITTIMPMPEDEDSWSTLDVMFATSAGTVRRNKLSDFVGIRQNGKIAMKPDEGVDIFSVETCSEDDDVILTTAHGQAIRFPVTDVRVFQSRDSMGVRGIRLGKGDTIISMTIVKHMDATPAERAGYLRQAIAQRRLASMEEDELEEVLPADDEDEEEAAAAVELSPERFAEMEDAEQFVLTVSAFGYGKRASTFDFRTSRRGGKGIKATDQSKMGEIGELVAAFPVEDSNQIMLVSDGGQLIRVPVNGIRFAGRATKGVRIFNTAANEKVVSVELVSDVGEDENEDDIGEAGEDDTVIDVAPDSGTDDGPDTGPGEAGEEGEA